VIGAVIRKDVALLLRDRGALISLFALPVLFMLVFGAIFRFGPDRGLPRAIAMWHAPGDPRGIAIGEALVSTQSFTLVRHASADDVRAAVADERAAAGVIVLPEAEAPIEVVVDDGAPLQVRGPLEGALEGLIVRVLLPPDVRLAQVVVTSAPGARRPLARMSSFQVSVPGNAVLFGFFLALTVAMSFATERRSGTWRRLLAAPVPRWQALAGTLVPYYLIGLAQLAFFFTLGVLAFGMQVAGSLAALAALSAALAFCAVALGLLFAAIGGSERQLGAMGSVVLLVMGMVGGCMVPRLIMPPFMQSLGLAVPHGWALDGYYDVLVRTGTSISDVLPAIGALLAFGTVFAGVGLALFRFER
jgi:ABC-2 type transport system permease protein